MTIAFLVSLVVVSILGIRLVFVQIDRDYYESMSRINRWEADTLRKLLDIRLERLRNDRMGR